MLGACVGAAPERSAAMTESRLHAAQGIFISHLDALCGKAFAGRISANEPASPNDPFAGKRLIMHVRECAPDGLRIPFHVGDDRSRTWVISKLDRGLRLKHDHRHADGSADAVTQYGGDTVGSGTQERQEFPVDAYSRNLFERESMQVSMTNIWAIEIHPGQRLVYELSRPGRLFRVEFDLHNPVPPPAPPWGASDREADR
jgi:hypothetical protein